VTRNDVTELSGPTSPPLGLNKTGQWTASEVELGDRWTLLLYTDGMIEGRIGHGPRRLGTEGLMDLVRDVLGPQPFDHGRIAAAGLPQQLMDEVLKLTSGAVADDMCVLMLGRP
jgi:serine phosphatase RsbU (regulator of sigma subunit)